MALKKLVKSTSKYMSIGGKDKDDNDYPPYFEGYYVGRRQGGTTSFKGETPKPVWILFFVTKGDMKNPTGLYEKGDLKGGVKGFPFKKGAFTTIQFLKKGPPFPGASYRMNLYDVMADESDHINVDDVTLPVNITGDQDQQDEDQDVEATTEDQDNDESDSDEAPAPVHVSVNKAKVEALLNKNRAKN